MKLWLLILLAPVALVLLLLLLFLFSPGFKRRFGKYFYNWLFGLKWAETRTTNYGYAPVSPETVAHSEAEKYQLELYRAMAASVGDAAWEGKEVLEVGCGRGGGIHFLYKLLKPKRATGLDFSHNAIRDNQLHFAAEEEGLRFVQGDSAAIPFEPSSFGIVFNVESSHIYSAQGTFLKEAARVLKPGGSLIIADYRRRGDAVERLKVEAKAAGLTLTQDRCINAEVLAACKADTERRAALLKVAPAFSRGYLKEFAMTHDSREYAHFDRDYYYFIMVFEK